MGPIICCSSLGLPLALLLPAQVLLAAAWGLLCWFSLAFGHAAQDLVAGGAEQDRALLEDFAVGVAFDFAGQCRVSQPTTAKSHRKKLSSACKRPRTRSESRTPIAGPCVFAPLSCALSPFFMSRPTQGIIWAALAAVVVYGPGDAIFGGTSQALGGRFFERWLDFASIQARISTSACGRRSISARASQ